MHLSLEKNFAEPIFEDFLPERKARGKFVLVFNLGGGAPLLQPLGLQGGIHMCGCHLLEFLD